MQLKVVRNLGLMVLTLAGTVARSDAATTFTVPPGLTVGDTYRLVFVTADTSNAESTNIADYNTFVTTEADDNSALAALGATWTVIGSTEAVNASTNIGTGATTSGIFTLDGNEVAASTAALFNTASTSLLDPIDIDQNGNTDVSGGVSTGSTGTGTANTGGALGDSFVTNGIDNDENSLWIFNAGSTNSVVHPLYAISSVLTVQATTPEPSTVLLLSLGLGMISVLRLAKRSRKNS